MAYDYVSESEFADYRFMCSKLLKDTCAELKKKGISAQVILVGSGARNMVTRNGNGQYDLDYNLVIAKALEMYWNDLRRLKDTIRVTLDKCSGSNINFAEDSTSCLTARLSSNSYPNAHFKFDVAILAQNSNGNYMRLINNKNAVNGWITIENQYTWNEIPTSHNVTNKVKKLKEANKWTEVRDRYRDIKNDCLTGRHSNNPSFILYVEAVNQMYDKYFGRRQ